MLKRKTWLCLLILLLIILPFCTPQFKINLSETASYKIFKALAMSMTAGEKLISLNPSKLAEDSGSWEAELTKDGMRIFLTIGKDGELLKRSIYLPLTLESLHQGIIHKAEADAGEKIEIVKAWVLEERETNNNYLILFISKNGNLNRTFLEPA